jgi:hypothetical protein
MTYKIWSSKNGVQNLCAKKVISLFFSKAFIKLKWLFGRIEVEEMSTILCSLGPSLCQVHRKPPSEMYFNNESHVSMKGLSIWSFKNARNRQHPKWGKVIRVRSFPFIKISSQIFHCLFEIPSFEARHAVVVGCIFK